MQSHRHWQPSPMLQFRRNVRGSHPFADRSQAAAFRAGRCGKLSSAVGTNALRFKRVKGFPAFAATPECAAGRGDFAGRAGKSVVTRRIGDAGQGAGLHQTAPAIHRMKTAMMPIQTDCAQNGKSESGRPHPQNQCCWRSSNCAPGQTQTKAATAKSVRRRADKSAAD